MPNCRKTRFLGLSAYCAFNCAYWSSRDCAACSALSGCGLQGPVDVTHWQFVQCLSHRPTSLLFPAKPAGQPAARHYLHARQSPDRVSAPQCVPDSSPARWKPAQSLRLWRIVGIAADPNRRDPGGKGKFSVGGRKRDDARRGVEPQRREKRQGDQRPEQ